MPARLYVTCYRDMALDSNNRPVNVPMAPPIAEAYIDIGPESSVSHEFPQYTHFICIRSDIDCAIAFGDDPIADPNYHIIEAGERLFYGVLSGSKIAVIGVDPEHDDSFELSDTLLDNEHINDG